MIRLAGAVPGSYLNGSRCRVAGDRPSPAASALLSQINSRLLALRHVARRASDVKVKFLSTGTVKWFNATKGYGFIQPEGKGDDVFVHISAVERAGLDTLNEGDRIDYEVVRGQNGKSSAENLKLAS